MPSLGGWEWVILIVVLVLLFGAKRLPDMARSIGQSARVFKGEMKGMKNDDARPPADKPAEPQAPPAALPPAQAQQNPPAQPTQQPAQQPVQQPAQQDTRATQPGSGTSGQ